MRKIIRNLVLVAIIPAIVALIWVVSLVGKGLLGWLQSVWGYGLTVVITAIVCAVAFGVADAISEKRKKKKNKAGSSGESF